MQQVHPIGQHLPPGQQNSVALSQQASPVLPGLGRHAEKPLAQTHTPATQARPGPHELPQPPQWEASVIGSTQFPPLQHRWPVGQHVRCPLGEKHEVLPGGQSSMHCPLTQLCPGGQQTPLQHTDPAAQQIGGPVGDGQTVIGAGQARMQVPPEQMVPSGQQTPLQHAPGAQQPVITPLEKQGAVPAGHGVTHWPSTQA